MRTVRIHEATKRVSVKWLMRGVRSRIMCGIGNQMFQYCPGLRVARGLRAAHKLHLAQPGGDLLRFVRSLRRRRGERTVRLELPRSLWPGRRSILVAGWTSQRERYLAMTSIWREA